jgi:cysteine desulfurase/selenocysteine lyase
VVSVTAVDTSVVRIDGWPDEVVGNGHEVPVYGGGSIPYAYLDNAASTPPLRAVVRAVNDFLPWYSSVHRGAGYKSRVSTAAYEEARERARDFVNAPDSHVVVFIKNTTEGINRLAALAEERGATVFVSIMEHHANLLPWRRLTRQVVYFGADEFGAVDEDDLRRKLSDHPTGPKIVAVAGAYNVSGYAPPLDRLARLCHEHGAEILVDAAQLAPHRPIDMSGRPGEEIDYLIFSGHKVYAPFGSGVMVAPRSALSSVSPALVGGGIVDLVTLDEVVWNGLPDREEAGTPNVVGAVALGAALIRLQELRRDGLLDQESALTDYLVKGLLSVPNLQLLGPRAAVDRVGVASFVIDGVPHGLVAAVLSYEHGIGIRTGCFCAHPGVLHLLQLPIAEADEGRSRMRRHDHVGLPGAARASLGVQNTRAEVDRLVRALKELVGSGPRASYRIDPSTGDYSPSNWEEALPLGL